MEYKYLRGLPNFVKQLTDVNDRLAVTIKMALMLPRAEPVRDTQIRVLDDLGDDCSAEKAHIPNQFFGPKNGEPSSENKEPDPATPSISGQR
ncbi:hypothetical protein RchiOBHm_Chr7g0182081 [Rosa chinensis]|uniref:Uncharacterized protein n=1 Tax=Rosa chinensis TaxID=74649 RepID=A0A2P6P2V4_ROSCH|nr:hypothetical protein RchiOBHm_Chr7g0182081 [Rosa chinensis]